MASVPLWVAAWADSSLLGLEGPYFLSGAYACFPARQTTTGKNENTHAAAGLPWRPATPKHSARRREPDAGRGQVCGCRLPPRRCNDEKARQQEAVDLRSIHDAQEREPDKVHDSLRTGESFWSRRQ